MSVMAARRVAVALARRCCELLRSQASGTRDGARDI